MLGLSAAAAREGSEKAANAKKERRLIRMVIDNSVSKVSESEMVVFIRGLNTSRTAPGSEGAVFDGLGALKFEVFSLQQGLWFVGSCCGFGSWGIGFCGVGALVEGLRSRFKTRRDGTEGSKGSEE
jgi:hypothetical protein